LKEYATGMRAVEQGRTAEAEAAAVKLDAGLDAMRKKTELKPEKKAKDDRAQGDAAPSIPIMPDASAGPLVKEFTIASLELRAGILVSKGKLDDAKKMYAEAEKKEKDLGYREPPFYIRPVGETEAVALLRAKDYVGAAAGYKAGLADRPASGFDLYGLARVKELAGDAAGAKAGYAEFLKAWPKADAGLPEMVHAREFTGMTATAAL
jgi:hypothetical protein